MILKLLVSLIPVFLYLIMLLYLDSLKLVRKNLLVFSLLWGFVSAGLSYGLNTLLIGMLPMSFPQYSMIIAPIVEETIKFTFILLLIRKHQVGFMIDGAIYAFSVGAAFSFVENLFYLFTFASSENNLMVWIVRGFGTAVMHGGATASMAIICMSALNRSSHLLPAASWGALASFGLHAIYNAFLINPIISTLIILLLTPTTIIMLFATNEKNIRNWLDLEFDSEANMLRMIQKGQFSSTKSGIYLVSLKQYLSPETLVDLMCYLSLYFELSIKAKSILLLREAGFVLPPDPGLREKLNELKALEKIIGKSGFLAISPILRINRKDLWKLNLLEG